MTNPYRSLRVNSYSSIFPVTCLNRDWGHKTAIIGGSTRARSAASVGNVRFGLHCTN